MMKLLDKILPENDIHRKWYSIGGTVVMACLLTLFGIYGIGEYGIALFIVTPFLIGACSVSLYGYKKEVTRGEAIRLGLLTLGMFGVALIAFAIEGLICIAMVTPLAVMACILGSLIARTIQRRKINNSLNTVLLLWSLVPLLSFVEHQANDVGILPVTTSIVINADLDKVWENVTQFSELPEPEELLFKAGVAFPTHARIEGTGVGAVRHCVFSTGSFVEPITTWDAPNLLQFNVDECPPPMKELNFWDINAPHLHDYFVSKKGQFKLTRLEDGTCLLEGTTWYTHNIKPALYWRLWSDYIIHEIHERVLTHIKNLSEAN